MLMVSTYSRRYNDKMQVFFDLRYRMQYDFYKILEENERYRNNRGQSSFAARTPKYQARALRWEGRRAGNSPEMVGLRAGKSPEMGGAAGL